jgi:hypothetical protein
MAELAVEYNLGADILSKGNRKVESQLAESKCSGDTVNVPITDSGIVYDNLDISSLKGKLAVRRAFVPVKVRPIGTAAEASAEQLTLAINDRDLMAKRVANLQDETNSRAFEALLSGAQAFNADPGASPTPAARDDVYGLQLYDADAHVTASKFAGETFALAHPQTWNRLTRSLGVDFGANNKIGNTIYRNELGPLLGHSWSKSAINGTITGVEQSIASFYIGANGFNTAGVTATAAGLRDGELSQPVFLKNDTEYLQAVDALGKPTGIPKTFYFRWDAIAQRWNLAQPVFLEGPRKNAHSNNYDALIATYQTNIASFDMTYNPQDPELGNYAASYTTNGFQVTTEDVLTEDAVYLQPAMMWKQNDFLVAVKGLKKQAGPESFTIPTEFAEKGILPLRGHMWTDSYTDQTLFRADALMGFGLYQGISVTATYLRIR